MGVQARYLNRKAQKTSGKTVKLGVKERYEQRQQEAEQATGVQERYEQRQRYIAMGAEQVDQDFLNRFSSDAGDFLNRAGSRELSYTDAGTALEQLENQWTAIQGWIGLNGIDVELEENADFKQALDSIRGGLDSARDYYGQWETEDAYNTYWKQKDELDALLSLDLENYAQQIETLRQERQTHVDTTFDWTDNQQRDAYDQRLQEYDLDIAAMEQRLQQARQLQEEAYYESLPEQADFQQRGNAGWENYQASRGVEDPEESWLQWLSKTLGKTSDTSLPNAQMAQAQNAYAEDTSYMEPGKDWTEQQKQTFGYLYSTDRETAQRYAQYTNEQNNQAQNAEKIAAIQEWAIKNGWNSAAATLASIAMMPLSLADTLDALAEYSARGTLTTKAVPMPGQVSAAINSAVSSELNEKYGTISEKVPVLGGKGLGDAYQLAVSIANSMLAGNTQGTLGTYVTFFGSAASSEMMAAKEAGATDQQAILRGVLSGLAEAAGEAFSVGNLLDAGQLKNFWLDVLKQAGIEASEEGMTTLLKNFAEQIVMGHQSSFYKQVNQYRAEGLSTEEAKRKAWGSMTEDLIFDMMGGAASGGVSSSIQMGINDAADAKYYEEVYGEEAMALVKEALELDPGNTYALWMQKKLETGNALSGGELRELVQQNEEAMKRPVGATGKSMKAEETENNTPEEEIPVEENTDQSGTQTDTMEVAEEANTRSAMNSDQETAGGREIPQAAQEDITQALAEASKKYGVRGEAMRRTYLDGQNVAEYARAFDIAYNMGRSGVSLDYTVKSKAVSYLTQSQRELAHGIGRSAANSEAAELAQANAAAANGKTQRRKGTVKGEGVSIDDLKATFNDPQGRAYRYLAAVAEVTGIDIVLYRSQPGEDGNFTGEQGRYRRSDPGKVYIDLNAGLMRVDNAADLGKYTMLRTFAHEFTHFIEKWNPEQYNELRSVVFDTMAQKGEDIHDLIELRMAQENISYDAASREVVAEALTDILPDSSFVQELAEKHQTIFRKLLEKLKDFLEDMREAFRRMHPNSSREAQALKEQAGEQVRYLESIVEAFDRAAVQAVENYQLTVAGDAEIVSEQETTAKSDEEAETDTAAAEPNHAEVSAENEGLPQPEETPKDVPAVEETEEAKQELRKAVRMPIQGTNAEALLAGIRNRELSMASITMGGTVEGFNEEQRRHLVEKLLEGVYTDKESIRIDVPYDGKFEIVNTPGNVAKVLENLKVKAVQDVLFSKQTIGLLTAKGDIRITSLDGEPYLSNTALMLRASEVAVEYVRKEYPTKENPIHPEIEKTMRNINTPVTVAPMEGKLNKTPVLIFQEDGKQFVFDKRYFAPMDGYTLYYGTFNGSAILKAVDSDGKAFGYLMGLKPGAVAKITDIKPSKLRSFAKKKTNQSQNAKAENREQTAPKAEEAAPKAESVQKKKTAPKKERQEKPKTVEASVKLEDFGEKIGGARKDQWSKRGLVADDLEAMNERERANHVKKDNVWKRPDYRKLIEGGQDRNLLFVRNEIRKALNQNIVYPYNTTEDRKKQIQVEFVETVRTIQAMAEQMSSKEALIAMGRPWLMEQGYRTDRSFTDKWRKNPALQGTNYVQTIEYLTRNWDQLDKLADKANFAVDAEQKIPAGYSIHEDDKVHTWFIARGSWVIMNGIPSYQEAMDILRGAAAGKKKKTRFVPQQLLEVHRKGPDYRGGRDVNGQDYLDTFGFKGGEFGNWMNEKDRRVSMNYGFDALKDLADALGIQDRDISLGGNLSIAFGARGQGLSGAAAHYESERRVINLTKMNGAGSLAHEWFHALDDFLGEYGSRFATEQHRKLPEATREAIRNLLTTMQYRDATQEETDLAATKAYEQAQRSVTYQVSNQFGWVQKLEKGSLTDADTRYFARKPTQADAQKYHDLLNQLLETGDPALVDALSALRKEVNGRVILKEDREAIGYRLHALKPSETKQVQKMRLRSDFYENSRKFGQLHHKDGDYWDSTIEMAARAFACYVADKTGKRNDYLSAHSDTAVTLTADKDGKPVVVRAFPVGAERTAINGAFDQLFAALKADGFLHPAEEAEKPGMVQYQRRKNENEIDEYDTDGVHWALEYKIISAAEARIIWEAIANTEKRGYYYPKTITGECIVPSDNALFFVTMDYHYPSVNKVVRFNEEYIVNCGYAKELIINARGNPSRHREALRNVADLYGDGFAVEYDRSIYQANARKNGRGEGTHRRASDSGDPEQHQQRSEALSDREILLAASEELMAGELTSGEADALAIIQRRLNKLEELQSQRAEEGKLYRQQQFTPGADRAEAQKTLNRMKILESQIQRAENEVLSAEDKQVLKRVLQKAREIVQKQQWTKDQETLKRWRNRRKDSQQKAEVRRKIRKASMDLEKLLNRGDKKNNVKDGMQDFVSDALVTIDTLFMDHYGDETMVRNGVGTELTSEENRYLREAKEILTELDQLPGGYEGMLIRQEQEPNLKSRLSYRMVKLKDVFARERSRLNKTKVSDVLGKLADSYAALRIAENEYIQQAYHENVYQYLLMMKEDIGGTVVKDMTLDQLEELYKGFTMVVTTVRNANRMFAQNIKFRLDILANNAMEEVRRAGGPRRKQVSPLKKVVENISWGNTKPVYAFERLGSETLKTLYGNIRKGQDVWAVDMQEANDFRREQYRKNNRKMWDMEELHSFTSASGLKFQLNLEQIMSLYAYSRREAALEHLLKGGFVFSGETKITVNENGIKKWHQVEDATAYNLTQEELAKIINTLTKEQKSFVEEMQGYLSETMGKKGNEVSLALYGILLFKEENYFPLHAAGQYMEKAREDSFRKEQGQISIVNSGFTKPTTPGANAPITLDGFMDVWAEHVNEMSMYHGFALPMEDFRRVYNFRTLNTEANQSNSVRATVENSFGKTAVAYIDQLYKDLNGGAIGDPRESLSKRMIAQFKKGAVLSSASVVVQQPSSIGRAFALIDPRFFVGESAAGTSQKESWAELKKYAPVAVIKEMGYFDTDMGRGAKDFLQSEEYSGWEAVKGFLTDSGFRDEILSMGAAKADEITWCAIWNAVKRETAYRNPSMMTASETFLQAAGARFSEIIDKTQVYDSVLSRSGNMRSKSAFMNAATSFMSEPTASMNMMEDALRKAISGDKKGAVRAITAVYTSVVLNSAMVSVVYAMRDDDEDETFSEKYLSSLTSELLDGLNPVTYYPMLKDIWSLLQGYNVERADMSLIADVIDALDQLCDAYGEDTQDMTEEELEANREKIQAAWLSALDSLTNLTGLPVKNIRRDIDGLLNFFNTIQTDMAGRPTTKGSITDALEAAIRGAIPVFGRGDSESLTDKLYGAIVSGDQAYIERLRNHYETLSAYNSAIRKGLRENDSRIRDAALAWNADRLEEYMSIAQEIIDEGNFDQDNVVMAIMATADNLVSTEPADSAPQPKGLFNADKFAVAIAQGDADMAVIIRENIIETAMRKGKDMEEAEESFVTSAANSLIDLFKANGITALETAEALVEWCGYEPEEAALNVNKSRAEIETGIAFGDIMDAYLDSQITAIQARDMLVAYGSYTKEEADNEVRLYEWTAEGYDISLKAVVKYETFCAPVGVEKGVYYDAYRFYLDSGEEGVSYSKLNECMPYIDSLPLTAEQKTALALCWWAESTVRKNKLW